MYFFRFNYHRMLRSGIHQALLLIEIILWVSLRLGSTYGYFILPLLLPLASACQIEPFCFSWPGGVSRERLSLCGHKVLQLEQECCVTLGSVSWSQGSNSPKPHPSRQDFHNKREICSPSAPLLFPCSPPSLTPCLLPTFLPALLLSQLILKLGCEKRYQYAPGQLSTATTLRKKNHKISVACSNQHRFHSWVHWSHGVALLSVHFWKSGKRGSSYPQEALTIVRAEEQKFKKANPLSQVHFKFCLVSICSYHTGQGEGAGKGMALNKFLKEIAKEWVQGEIKNRVGNSIYHPLKSSTTAIKKNGERQAAQWALRSPVILPALAEELHF